MSEVEKFYENVGIKPLPTCNNCNMLDEYWSNGTYCSTCRNDKDNNECSMADFIYPPFTAEKQLEILCFIVNNKHSVTFHDQVFRGDKLTLEKIQENLAWAINRIWQDLTSEEKQQVKGILE